MQLLGGAERRNSNEMWRLQATFPAPKTNNNTLLKGFESMPKLDEVSKT